MTKILYIITQSEAGGAQKNALDLAVGLTGQYEILVAAGPDGQGWLFKELSRKGIKNIQLKWLCRQINPFFDALAILEIRRLIKKERPNIVHLHSSKAGWLGALAGWRLGAKIIYTSHGAAFGGNFARPAKKIFLWAEKFSALFKDKIICVSQNEKNVWLARQAAPEAKLVVIENGIDAKNLQFLTKDEARAKLLAGQILPPQTKIIGTVANFYPDKGLPFLIKTADIILNQQKISDVVFLVIGDGRQRELLEEMIENFKLSDKFILAGLIPGAIKYLKAFDIFVQPSVKEGFGYTVLEAMAAGLPIVATSTGGIPQMIENDFNGFWVLPGHPEMLAQHLAELLRDPKLAQRLAQNSQARLNDFSLKKMIDKTREIYESV